MIIANYFGMIDLFLNVNEAELIVSGMRALQEKYEKERTMTRTLKDRIISIIVILENEIMLIKDQPEDRTQNLFEI